jgi:hypothetical protein
MTRCRVSDLLQPVRETSRPDPADHFANVYVRSFLIVRIIVGVLGLLLPVLLVVGTNVFFDEGPFPRNSLSAYYFSGGRDLFVGILCALGVFLIGYKVAEANLDNTLTLIAGVAAVCVALFPTSRPSELATPVPLTALQVKLGEGTVTAIHYVSAGVFLVSLAVLSYQFGKREYKRPPGAGARSRRFWRDFHFACAGLIVLGLAAAVILQPITDAALLIGEVIAVVAFAISWLFKGLEIDALRSSTQQTVTKSSLDAAS